MTVTTESNTVTTSGNMKSAADTRQLLDALTQVKKEGHKSIMIDMQDSLLITSEAIGYLLQCVKVEHIDVTIKSRNECLSETLREMQLDQVFNVKTY